MAKGNFESQRGHGTLQSSDVSDQVVQSDPELEECVLVACKAF